MITKCLLCIIRIDHTSTQVPSSFTASEALGIEHDVGSARQLNSARNGRKAMSARAPPHIPATNKRVLSGDCL